MVEIIKQNKEKPIYIQAFEHVFPGNKFESARRGSLLEYLVFIATAITDYNYVSSIMVPSPDAGNLIHRIPFEEPSQLMINYYLGKTTKLVFNHAPTGLTSTLQENEIIGGTIETRSSIPSIGVGGSVIWVTGVMNQEKLPKALIAHRFFKRATPSPRNLTSQKLEKIPAF